MLSFEPHSIASYSQQAGSGFTVKFEGGSTRICSKHHVFAIGPEEPLALSQNLAIARMHAYHICIWTRINLLFVSLRLY